MTASVTGRLLAVGDAHPDLVLAADQSLVRFVEQDVVVPAWELTVGGSASIFACAAAQLGIATEFIGTVGDDTLGRLLLAGLKQAGVDAERCRSEPATRSAITVVLSNPSDRAILMGAGSARAVSGVDILPALRGVRHLHIGGLFIVPGLVSEVTELLAQARATGATTSLDTNWDPTGRWELPDGLYGVLDYLLVNEQEALRLAGHGELSEAGANLARTVGTVVVKRGPRGASAFIAGADTIAVSAYTTHVVDTTGAGDNFDAGFVCGRMPDLGLRKSLELGCACGSLSTRALGGTTARVGLEESLALAGSGVELKK